PRPTRILSRLAPGAGRRSCSLMTMSVDLLDRHQVADGFDHAAHVGVIRADHRLADLAQTEAAHGVALLLPGADQATHLSDLQLCHLDQTPCPARARRTNAGATSSSGRPRRAATSSGRCSCFSAATVACTMLIGLSLPSDLLSTSCTPAHSSTARTGPPAITPVPALAGRSSTTPAESSPTTGWVMVPPRRGTRKKFFFASSTPLAIAAGTSLALP